MNRPYIHLSLVGIGLLILQLCLGMETTTAQTFSLLEMQSSSSRYGIGDISDGSAVGYSSLLHDPSYLFKHSDARLMIAGAATVWGRSEALDQHLSMYRMEGAGRIGRRRLIYVSARALKPYSIERISTTQNISDRLSPYELAGDIGYAFQYAHGALFARVGGAFSDYYRKNMAYTLSIGGTYTHQYEVKGRSRRVDALVHLSHLAVLRSGDDVKSHYHVPTSIAASLKYSLALSSDFRLGVGTTATYVLPKSYDYLSLCGGIEAVYRDHLALSMGMRRQSSSIGEAQWMSSWGVRYAFSRLFSFDAIVNVPISDQSQDLKSGHVGLVCYF